MIKCFTNVFHETKINSQVLEISVSSSKSLRERKETLHSWRIAQFNQEPE
jgi:hypothetical protein